MMMNTFQLTASRRGWHSFLIILMQSQTFQLTASRRGWRIRLGCSYVLSYFNSQPHEEADELSGVLPLRWHRISTHSLTKRLTMIWFKTARYHSFQLTASRRGWRPLTLMLKGFWLFQLTASRRGWQLFLERHILHEWISTHSLTKRLTTTANAPMIFPSLFQLTASRRGWLFQCIIPSSVVHFNSQPHEEADSKTFACNNQAVIFQLTASRRGWPYFFCQIPLAKGISTHSLTKRLTLLHGNHVISSHISTHSLTKRLTAAGVTVPAGPVDFNSQPHEEADLPAHFQALQ